MVLKKRLKKFSFVFSHYPFLNYLVLFLVVFLFFTFLQSNPTFADPDSFYHAKMALLIKDQGIVYNFPYLQFTVLKNNFTPYHWYEFNIFDWTKLKIPFLVMPWSVQSTGFTDHHFLYHLFLVPFIYFLDPLIGLKLTTILFATLAIVTFFWLLKKLKIKGAWIYTLILLVTNPFIFRLNLAKAQALALIALFLGLYFITERKYLHLFVLSFFYVWFYGGWPIIFVITVIYIFCSYLAPTKSNIIERLKFKIQNLKVKQNPKSKTIIKFIKSKFNQKILHYQNFKLFSAVSSGLIAGLVVNPYFPKNLYFYWQQIVQIAVLNYQKIIGVGGEWYPYNFLELIASSALVFILLVFGLTLFYLNFRKQSTVSWTFLLLAIFFFILTLKSRRNVEYFVPIAILFSAASINNFLILADFKNFLVDLKKFILENKIFILGLIIPLVLLPYVVYRDVRAVYLDNLAGFSFDQFKQSSDWLKNNSKAGQIVFHSDWDEFPILFYHNSLNYYIVGLDPTFMYNYNKDLYWQWYNVTIGQEKENLYSIIKNNFGADFVFVNWPSHQLLDRNLANNFYFEEVYRDSQTKIYKVN